jgi:maltose O-acetyltransferase
MRFIQQIFRSLYHRLLGRQSIRDHVSRGLKVGKNFQLQKDVILDYSHIWHIEIGDDVTIAPRAIVLAHDASTKRSLGYTRLGKVTIGNRVFIGAGSIILPGVTIGDDVIVGAGSVVSNDLPSGFVAAGSPARVIRATQEYLEEKRNELGGSPQFNSQYTTRGGITPAMKEDMNRKMKSGIGYVV